MTDCPPDLELWTVDEVAECLDVTRELSTKLWQIKEQAVNRTPLGDDINETLDIRLDSDNDDKIVKCWSLLTEPERLQIIKAWEQYGC